MILFALTFLLLIASFYNTKIMVYVLMLFFTFFDMFDGFYKDDKIYAALRYLVPIILIIYYVARYGLLTKKDTALWMLILYLTLCWLTNSGDFFISTRYFLAVIITLMMIPIGRHLTLHTDFVKDFEIYNRILLVAIPIYIIAANVLGFGESYSDMFSTGFFITSRMYIVPIVVFLAIHYTITNKNTSWLIKTTDITFIFINICILLINTRRTTFGMLLGALIIYTILNRKIIFKMTVMLMVTVASLILSYPLYQDQLTAQLEKRDRIQDIDTYEEEGRYLETLYIIDYFEMRGQTEEFLFGVSLFDTRAFGTKYFGRDRPIHSDINMLFYSTGLVGSIFFAIFIISYFLLDNRQILKDNRKLYYPMLFMFLIVLLPGRFIGTMTYAPLLILLLAVLKYKKPRRHIPQVRIKKEPVMVGTSAGSFRIVSSLDCQ